MDPMPRPVVRLLCSRGAGRRVGVEWADDGDGDDDGGGISGGRRREGCAEVVVDGDGGGCFGPGGGEWRRNFLHLEVDPWALGVGDWMRCWVCGCGVVGCTPKPAS